MPGAVGTRVVTTWDAVRGEVAALAGAEPSAFGFAEKKKPATAASDGFFSRMSTLSCLDFIGLSCLIYELWFMDLLYLLDFIGMPFLIYELWFMDWVYLLELLGMPF